jgi:hypothetical protein
MSDSKIRRKAKSYTVTLATAVAAVDAVPMVDMAGGVVSVGTMSTNASALNLYVSDEEDGTYRQLHDSVGSPANITLQPSTAVGKAYALPDAAFGRAAHVDHITPKARGGSDLLDNLQTLCATCHQRKTNAEAKCEKL